MSQILTVLGHYWWIAIIIIAALCYKLIFRLLGIIMVPEDSLGLITKKFVLFGTDKTLPDGRIIALKGESGYQAATLSPGIYFGYFPWQYDIHLQKFTIIDQGKIGLITAKDGAPLSTGNLLGRYVECNSFQDAEAFLNNNGSKGRQSYVITTGSYRINTHLFDISTVEITKIPKNSVAVVTTLDGVQLKSDQIAGKEIQGHNNFQDFDKFLSNGGERGLQTQIIQSGSYYLNPWAVNVEMTPMTEIPIAHVGVVISYVGEDGVDTSGDSFTHANIVENGKKGIWQKTLDPGKYALNIYTTKVEIVPTANLVLNWANARTESHNLDSNLSTITVRSKDGFSFNIDVSQIISVSTVDAPKVIARFGTIKNLVSQVLEPTIGNYFRNSAQQSDVLEFVLNRTERQNGAKAAIGSVLTEYNIQAIDTLIGDIVPPKELMNTLTDRKIASELFLTYDTEQKAENKRQELTKAKAIADIQPEIVHANQGVEIAEKIAAAEVKKAEGIAQSMDLTSKAEANKTMVTGDAEASKILAIGKANAEAYQAQVNAMGQDGFSNLKLMEAIGENNIKITPEILVTGGGEGGGVSTALLGVLTKNLLKESEVKSSKK